VKDGWGWFLAPKPKGLHASARGINPDGLILSMSTITREELKQKMDNGEDFKLVNCLDEWMFRAKRIPGSIHFESLKQALETLDPKEEVIVYCSNFGCTASVLVYQQLMDHGFQNLKHYAGGIADWEDAGYPLEGDRVH
jgi:rhodanese-related sulfurtransferase